MRFNFWVDGVVSYGVGKFVSGAKMNWFCPTGGFGESLIGVDEVVCVI